MDREIVLYGTADMSEKVYEALSQMGVLERFVFYVDGNPNKKGTNLHGKEICSPERLLDGTRRIVIACSYQNRLYDELRNRYEHIHLINIYSSDALWIWYQIYVRKREITIEKLAELLFMFREKGKKSLLFESVDVIITEQCTLRCKNCVQMIPYYTKPQNYDVAKIVESVKQFSKLVDGVWNVRVIGGEPFLHPELIEICKACVQKNFVHITVTTNGTIVPKDEVLSQLSELPVDIVISDYSDLSTKLEALTGKLAEYHIAYSVLDDSYGWYKTEMPKKYNRAEVENDTIFQKCKSKQNQSILNGSLYRCNYSGAVEPFGLIDNTRYDLLNKEKSLKEMREELYQFEKRQNCIQACDYCIQWKEIPVKTAEQLERKYGGSI